MRNARPKEFGEKSERAWSGEVFENFQNRTDHPSPLTIFAIAQWLTLPVGSLHQSAQ